MLSRFTFLSSRASICHTIHSLCRVTEDDVQHACLTANMHCLLLFSGLILICCLRRNIIFFTFFFYFYRTGYGKLPDYELLITDYLVELARRKGKKLGSGGPALAFEESPSASWKYFPRRCFYFYFKFFKCVSSLNNYRKIWCIIDWGHG